MSGEAGTLEAEGRGPTEVGPPVLPRRLHIIAVVGGSLAFAVISLVLSGLYT
ncbi:MAG TPA: hypothetical protein VM198_10595 [Longimicrobiales bacterium]|nr:hypothetical protein [Longimicrobiales bacterium]